jgi:hypothetical protein
MEYGRCKREMMMIKKKDKKERKSHESQKDKGKVGVWGHSLMP